MLKRCRKTTLLILVFLCTVLISSEIKSETKKEKGIKDTQEITKQEKTKIQKTYGRLPLYFIENKGQIDKKVKYYEKGSGHATYFTEEGIYLSLTSQKEQKQTEKREEKISKAQKHKKDKKKETEVETIKLTILDSNKNPSITAQEKQKGKVNYFIGNDKDKWKTNIPTYKQIQYKEVYKGIDIKFYGNNRQLEYDIIISPGSDPKTVKLSYEGIQELKITKDGELQINLKQGSLIQKRPHIYQEIEGEKVEIAGSFKILSIEEIKESTQDTTYTYGFEVAKYDTIKPLIIDPVLSYSTYLGGNGMIGSERGKGISVDPSGSAYIAGSTMSTDFPLVSPIQWTNGGSSDVFVTKIDPTGTSLVYSTYLGGTSNDYGEGISVDPSGSAYITGQTWSTDFPLASPIDGTLGGSWDVFVTKIDSTGTSLAYSTYLGGSDWDEGLDISVDQSGNAYITGDTNSTDFPLASPIQGTNGGSSDVFVTKIDSTGTSLVYSTYLGGWSSEYGKSISVDPSGNAYITGDTYSNDFPLASPIDGTLGDGTPGGGSDAFVTKIDTTGTILVYSTYLGGSDYDNGEGISVDTSGNAYITGYTSSTDFPLVSPIQGTYGGGSDVFVTKIDSTGTSLTYSTYLGGSNYDSGRGISVDTSGNAYIVGSTSSTDFPLASPIQGTYGGGGWDAFVTKIDSTGTSLVYSTYIGGSDSDGGSGISVDTSGSAYITGYTSSTDFPLSSPIQGTYGGGSGDAFVTKISEDPLPDIKANGSDDPVVIPQGSNLTVDISLDPGTHSGENADWWILIFYYNPGTGSWVPIVVNNFLQAPLFDLPPVTILNTSGLPSGAFIFLYGVDMNMNGLLDNPLFYDLVVVVIQ